MLKTTNCGHESHHPTPCSIEHERGLSEYLLLLVKTDAWFMVDGQKCFTQPNMCILFDKNTYICYGRDKAHYNDDWVHFTSDDEALMAGFRNIPLNQPFYPADFRKLSLYVQLLAMEYHAPSARSEEVIDSLLKGLLCSLDADLSSRHQTIGGHKHYSDFSDIRVRLYNDPSTRWSAQIAAESLDLSLSYFQHVYKRLFGCAFQQDVINARLKQAKLYLSNSSMSIRDLSEFCGYENELHFMRQFKKCEGVTPSEYRREQQLQREEAEKAKLHPSMEENKK